jgi:hypothetical protein
MFLTPGVGWRLRAGRGGWMRFNHLDAAMGAGLVKAVAAFKNLGKEFYLFWKGIFTAGKQ